MSEQDKRAERWMFLGDRIERRTKGPWDEPADYVRADDHAAALAQARREGVEAMRDLAIKDWSAGTVYSRGTAKTWLTGLAARLSKGGIDERVVSEVWNIS